MKHQADVAAKNGWHPLGESEVEVETPLTDEEKMDLGREQAVAIGQIELLKDQMADAAKEFKGKVEAKQLFVKSTASILRKGKKSVFKTLPFFLNREKTKRYWVDTETGEVVHSCDSTREDLQMKLEQM